MYPEALLCGSERFYGLGHPSGLRLYILFGPKILFHLRARSIWTHSRLDSDQKGVTRESKASSAKIAPKSIKIQSYYPKSSIFNLFGNVLGGFWATLCTFQGHLDRLDVFFGPTNAFKHIKFENIRNLTLITDLKVPSLSWNRVQLHMRTFQSASAAIVTFGCLDCWDASQFSNVFVDSRDRHWWAYCALCRV